ncbi:hypothetical protein FGO68_gene4626 [Halteria grandinella]|uniref:Cyclic nucleotide-binding domain-containing protein n=1 Tax=Halteria grandinella TaxID=5974 RepID=A0A8J8NF53_HALGN|nr:hypothetical protein FGO68_gene4626 [Halteria grandinella]
MKAMCLKKMLRFDEAIATYNLLKEEIHRAESKALVKCVFSLITLFTNVDRSKVGDTLDSFQSIMEFYGVPNYSQSASLTSCYVLNDGWRSDKVELVIEAIKNRSFFQRFSKSHLLHFMKFMRFKKFNKGDLLFVENEVMVLLDGLVFMKSHTENVVPPIMQAKYQQGDIIGYSTTDGGISNKVETWCLAQVPTEVAVFSPQDFDFVWTHHKYSKSELLVRILRTHPFFGNLSEQTIYLLAFELIKVRTFTGNQLIMSQSKRSTLNYCYREFFENKMSDVQMEIIQQRNRLREQCEAENKSMFTAMMQQIRRKRIAMDLNIPIEKVNLKEHDPAFLKAKQSDYDNSSAPSSARSIQILQTDSKQKSALFQRLSTLTAPRPSQPTGNMGVEINKAEVSAKLVNPLQKEFDLLKANADTAEKYSNLMNHIQEKECDGVYIIDTGRCSVVNPYDNYHFASLSRGDYFGESHFLKIPSYNYFGDIITDATVSEVTCFFISEKDFQRIPLHEMLKLRDHAIKRLTTLQYSANRKYGVAMEQLSEY